MDVYRKAHPNCKSIHTASNTLQCLAFVVVVLRDKLSMGPKTNGPATGHTELHYGHVTPVDEMGDQAARNEPKVTSLQVPACSVRLAPCNSQLVTGRWRR